MCITNNNLTYFLKTELLNYINNIVINNIRNKNSLVYKYKNKISTINSPYTLLLDFD